MWKCDFNKVAIDFSNDHVTSFWSLWDQIHVWEPFTLSQQLAYFGVHTSSAGGDMYFNCHVTPQDHSIEVSCMFMSESSSQYITTLKSLVTIGILIV